MNWTIIPFESIGPILLGSSREGVRASLGLEPKPFKKTPFSKTLTDSFDFLGIHVYYDTEDRCEAVEFFGPASPELDSMSLLGQPAHQLLKEFQALDANIEQDEAGFTSHRFGVALFASAYTKEPSAPVEGVLVFSRNYYS